MDKLAEVEETLLLLLFNVKEIELLALVSEEKLGATRVELQIINLGVMVDSSDHLVLLKVLDADCHDVKKVSDNLRCLLRMLGVTQAGTDEVRMDVLSATGSDKFIHSVFYD